MKEKHKAYPMKGGIRRQGKNSWQLKFTAGRDQAGNRLVRFVTVPGTRQDAQRALTAHLHALNEGTFVDPTKITVREYIAGWLDQGAPSIKGKKASPKTLERYRQLAEQQIFPHLGATGLQKLKPAHVQEWHSTLLKSGGKGGRELAPRTVGHAHRVLHSALSRAAQGEIVARNVASKAPPPEVQAAEVEILSGPQMVEILAKLTGHQLHAIAAVALGTGMRRGELCGLQWGDVDLEKATAKVERAVEETKAGLRVKPPKTKHGRRVLPLPPFAVEVLTSHRRQQRETRLNLGLGRETADTFVFGTPMSSPMSPDKLSRDWHRAVASLRLPPVTFHALRHTCASALIAAGQDVVKVSRHLGHGSPNVTLTVYAHLFDKTDASAADAIEAALRKGKEG